MRWLRLWLAVVPMFAADIRRVDPPAAAESGMPFLASSPDGKLYLSWTDMLGGKDHAFRFSRWSGNQWTAPETIATGNNWFVNWADFPSIVVMDDGSMLAHWLTRADDGGKFGYGIRIAKRSAGEARWAEIHGMSLDEKTDYAGFLSFIPGEGKAVFLSPPQKPDSHHQVAAETPDHHGSHRKTLRFISFQANSKVESDLEVDADTCSCCPTTIGRTKRGLIAAYRDHQPSEIRDISIIRHINGHWTEPATLHPDGWKINGCPTDGPSLAIQGDQVAVTWLTRANGVAKVQIAASQNSGETFAKPIRLDSGNPLGRPAIAPVGKGSFVVVWIEKTTGEQNELRMRRVLADGGLEKTLVLAKVPAGRLAGFPKVAVSGEDIVVAWRDQKVRAVIVTPSQKDRKSSTEK